jgi:integrase
MIGCGLRRGEVAALSLQQLQQREARWVIVDLTGKAGRVRSVAMPGWCKAALDEWTVSAAISSGPVFRGLRRGERVTAKTITAYSIYEVVRDYAGLLGLKIAPHDLRRTHAKLAYNGGSRLEQIQLALGHASVQTTERYLGTEQDFGDAPCDRLGILSVNPKA